MRNHRRARETGTTMAWAPVYFLVLDVRRAHFFLNPSITKNNMASICCLRVHVLKFNPHCEVLYGWTLNLTVVLRGKALGRDLDKITGVDPPHLNY